MKELDESLPATFTTETSRARGVNPRDLYAWRDGGQIIELSRGVFRPELDLCSGFRGFGHVSRLVSRIWASGSGH